MPYPWIDAYCLSKKGVTKDDKEEWGATRYQVGGKMFAMQGGDKEGTPIFTRKLPPDFGRFLREQYPDIAVSYTHLALTGSRPEKGSSKMTMSGSCSRVEASWIFC